MVPEKVCVVQAGDETKYLVKCFFTGKWVVNIYNRTLSLITTKNNISPDGLTVTPGGKLLLVHKNKFHEYCQDGRFIRELLNKYQFKNIRDITYSTGCLWVLKRATLYQNI